MLGRHSVIFFKKAIKINFSTSSDGSAEITSAVGKLSKNTGIPVFSYKLFYSLPLLIKNIRLASGKVCCGYSAKSIKRHVVKIACHVVKIVFPGNI